MDCKGFRTCGSNGVVKLVECVVLDVEDWPVFRTPGFEEGFDVFYELGSGARTPFCRAFDETVLQVDEEENRRSLGFGSHVAGDGEVRVERTRCLRASWRWGNFTPQYPWITGAAADSGADSTRMR